MTASSMRVMGVALSAAVLSVIASATATAADTSTAAACVEPNPSLFNIERLDPTRYQVSLADASTVTCTAFNVSSYRIPDTWDRNGWNETALPQTEFAYTTLTFPAGGTAPVTATVPVPDCGPYQTDLYTGPRLTYLEWPSPMAGVRLKGVMEDQAACSSELQSPSISPTPAQQSNNNTPTAAPTGAEQLPAGQSTTGSASVLPTKAAAPKRREGPRELEQLSRIRRSGNEHQHTAPYRGTSSLSRR